MSLVKAATGEMVRRRVEDLTACRIEVFGPDVTQERKFGPAPQFINQSTQEAYPAADVNIGGIDENHDGEVMSWAGLPRKARVSAQAPKALPSAIFCAAESRRAQGESR